ncbi:hypothetical protein [Spirosoma fluminis]
MSDDSLKTIGGLLVILLVVFCVTDCCTGAQRFCPGQVRQHVFHPAFTTISCTSDKHGSHCHTVYHPAEYHLLVDCQKPNHIADVNTGRVGYALYRDDDRVIVGEQIGRWTGIIWSDWIEQKQTSTDY